MQPHVTLILPQIHFCEESLSLFLSYASSLGLLITLHSFHYHLMLIAPIYLYTPQVTLSVYLHITNLLTAISLWVLNHFLKRNLSKTKLIIFPPLPNALCQYFYLSRLLVLLSSSSLHTCELGGILDSDLSFSPTSNPCPDFAAFTSVTFENMPLYSKQYTNKLKLSDCE